MKSISQIWIFAHFKRQQDEIRFFKLNIVIEVQLWKKFVICGKFVGPNCQFFFFCHSYLGLIFWPKIIFMASKLVLSSKLTVAVILCLNVVILVLMGV